MIRLMRDIGFYRHFGERNSRHRLERGERERDKDAVVSVTSVVYLQKKNLRLFLAMLYLKPLQNV